MNVEAVAQRVRAEFEEMPGMTLTVPQASRLFGLDARCLPASCSISWSESPYLRRRTTARRAASTRRRLTGSAVRRELGRHRFGR